MPTAQMASLPPARKTPMHVRILISILPVCWRLERTARSRVVRRVFSRLLRSCRFRPLFVSGVPMSPVRDDGPAFRGTAAVPAMTSGSGNG